MNYFNLFLILSFEMNYHQTIDLIIKFIKCNYHIFMIIFLMIFIPWKNVIEILAILIPNHYYIFIVETHLKFCLLIFMFILENTSYVTYQVLTLN